MSDAPRPIGSERAHCPRCGGSFPSGFRACPYDAATLVIGTDPLVGSTLVERYVIEKVLGEGGIGRVYLARHVRLNRRYAIKVPSARAATEPKTRRRFMREADVASRLDHPHVVGVLDFGETPAGLLYMVMELADGDSLTHHFAQRGRYPVEEAMALTRQLALGLDHAHHKGLIHRDLKPDNVIVERSDGRPRIVDFGLAVLREDPDRLTTRGMVVGTPHYMSPEQACGADVDHRADLFALGIMFYECLAGCFPYDGNAMEIVQKHINDPIPRIGERVPGLNIDPEVEQLCRWMVAKDPAARPQTARHVVSALNAISERLAAARGSLRLRRAAPPTIAGWEGGPLTAQYRRRTEP